MENFTFYSPTKIVFGHDTQKQAAELVKAYGGHRVFVVYGGGSVKRSGLLNEVTDLLKDAGLEVELFGGAQPNPRLQHARDGVAAAIAFQADFVLAIGGGSAIDTGKAIAHGLANPDIDIWRFWMKELTVPKTTPMGVILTIPAAGSESSNSAVLTNPEMGRKCGLTTDLNRPLFAILNPAIAGTLPPYQVACGVTDIMMHTLDRYFNPLDNELTDAIAEALLRTVITYGKDAVKDPHDYKAMSEVVWAGSLSHNTLTGLGGKQDFACHQLGHELSVSFDMAHGATLSAVWGSWAQYVQDAKPSRFARYARNVWGIQEEDEAKAVQAGIRATVEYFRSLGVPVSIREGVGEQSDEMLRELAHRCSYLSTRTIGSFKVLTEEDMYKIYSAANR